MRVEGAQGSKLRLVGTGGRRIGSESTVSGTRYRRGFAVPPWSSWVRAEVFVPDGEAAREAACDGFAGTSTTYCRNALGTLALSSALFVGP